MTNRWFRFYDDALNDPKVQRLHAPLFRTWINLLCLASKTDGVLPSVSDIAFVLRMSEPDAQSAVEELILAGLIDICPGGKMEPHNWKTRQFASDSSKDRTRKWRNRKAKTSGDVTVTGGDGKCDVIEPYPDTDTDKILVPSSSFPDPRESEAKEQSFKSDSKTEGGKGTERLHRRAEGLGLDVDELIGITNANKVKNRSAYFTSLCVKRVQQKVPGLEQAVVRAALWEADGRCFTLVCNAILQAEAA